MGYLSSLLPCGYSHKKRKKSFQTVELKVRMDCDGCEHKVKKCLSYMKGVRTVEINRKINKVTVTGYVEPNRVVKRVQSTGKKAEIWPYVPYNLVTNPYVTGTYDKKAPAGYVRKGEATQVPSLAIREEDKFTNLFSDDNPNACSIM
ncbi:heavy metal-associated isoprenylated plant protein 20-like [Dendrobium catenatum]|uniref:Heavy metal-associated isoprenylated plant protein 26 n=1 Tax=Dendrobium catenatum TaxID=906689 RepID=A0A2I0W737_9ASPA|nr:heavy metal-associated isoprenylated plant protein 20-like [Dendrobium catenatum]XP_020695304.1 heavy metal-associated isoprenylated plant protein 20-like [Dendrobium catenatum]PKU71472.1 Heavy metal-associated isoprenylated plant protein 26 [Dendrobium catenatum]